MNRTTIYVFRYVWIIPIYLFAACICFGKMQGLSDMGFGWQFAPGPLLVLLLSGFFILSLEIRPPIRIIFGTAAIAAWSIGTIPCLILATLAIIVHILKLKKDFGLLVGYYLFLMPMIFNFIIGMNNNMIVFLTLISTVVGLVIFQNIVKYLSIILFVGFYVSYINAVAFYNVVEPTQKSLFFWSVGRI